MSSPTLLELGWLAGIIDGEGSITIMKRGETFVPSVKMSNTSKVLIEKFCEILNNLNISHSCYGKQKQGNRKYQWEVIIEGRPRVYSLLLVLRDLLVSKTKQAEKVIEWIESRGINLRGPYTKEQLELVKTVKNLNGRGREFSEYPVNNILER